MTHDQEQPARPHDGQEPAPRGVHLPDAFFDWLFSDTEADPVPPGMPTRVHVVHGPAGSGKTRLLREHAAALHRHELPRPPEVWLFDPRDDGTRQAMSAHPPREWEDLDTLVRMLNVHLGGQPKGTRTPLLVLLDHLDPGPGGLGGPRLIRTLIDVNERWTHAPIGVLLTVRDLDEFDDTETMSPVLLAGSTVTALEPRPDGAPDSPTRSTVPAGTPRPLEA
ncbi:ATP-binding protein [Saccharothrix sp. HUAS TT1]|uniref:ATP-binding protein n=1 Tax=unclassified Saccharothrix TaxID=2593673 RepID=UPI00345B8AA0